MRVLSSCILSLLIHGLVFAAVLLGPFQGTKPPVDLDKPVYEVELVRPPEPEPEPEPKAEQKQETSKAKEKAREKEPSDKPRAVSAREAPSKKSRAEKVPRKSRTPQRERERAEKRTDPDSEPSRKKPEAARTPTSDKVLDQALQDLQKDVATERKRERTLAKELAELRRQRTEGRPGSTGAAQRKLYASLVEQRIKRNWRFPPIGGEANLVAEVRVRIDSSGAIATYSLVSGSGRSDYDSSVLRALEETERLPEPPRDLDTISITFNLRELRR
jgi:TonB family protein